MCGRSSVLMDDSPFDSFLCPITGDMMEDPVVTVGECNCR